MSVWTIALEKPVFSRQPVAQITIATWDMSGTLTMPVSSLLKGAQVGTLLFLIFFPCITCLNRSPKQFREENCQSIFVLAFHLDICK